MSLYDNIWVSSGVELPIASSGIVQFPERILGIDHETARRTVSDHAPVWMVLDNDVGVTALPAYTDPAAVIERNEKAAELPKVVGNKNSGIYHIEGCPRYTKTSARNRVAFETEDAAIADGFRKARNC